MVELRRDAGPLGNPAAREGLRVLWTFYGVSGPKGVDRFAVSAVEPILDLELGWWLRIELRAAERKFVRWMLRALL